MQGLEQVLSKDQGHADAAAAMVFVVRASETHHVVGVGGIHGEDPVRGLVGRRWRSALASTGARQTALPRKLARKRNEGKQIL